MARLIQPFRLHATPPPSQKVWLFDLDNTLHDASHAIFQQIEVSMNRAVMQSLNISLEEATALRKVYWKQYGATMIGMYRHHGIDPVDFLHLSHDFDIKHYVKKEPLLSTLLQQTPGVKYIVSNAPYHYALTVLKALKIDHCFAGMCALDRMFLRGDYHPKPSERLMRSLVHELGGKAERFILVEDTLKNLKTAKKIGMRCAHIYHTGTPFSTIYDGKPDYVDLKVHSIYALLQSDFARQA